MLYITMLLRVTSNLPLWRNIFQRSWDSHNEIPSLVPDVRPTNSLIEKLELKVIPPLTSCIGKSWNWAVNDWKSKRISKKKFLVRELLAHLEFVIMRNQKLWAFEKSITYIFKKSLQFRWKDFHRTNGDSSFSEMRVSPLSWLIFL